MAIVLRRTWRQKPTVPVQLDWSHPITKKLYAVIPCNEGAGTRAYNRVIGNPDFVVSTDKCAFTPDGVLRGSGWNGDVFKASISGDPSQGYSVLYSVTLTGTNTSNSFLIPTGVTGDIPSILDKTGYSNGVFTYRSMFTDNSNYWDQIGGSISAGVKTNISVSRSTTTNALVQDNIIKGSNTHAARTIGGTFATLELMNGNPQDGILVHCFYMWNRCLTVGEMQAITENPWQIWQPIRRIIYGGSAKIAYGTFIDTVASGSSANGNKLITNTYTPSGTVGSAVNSSKKITNTFAPTVVANSSVTSQKILSSLISAIAASSSSVQSEKRSSSAISASVTSLSSVIATKVITGQLIVSGVSAFAVTGQQTQPHVFAATAVSSSSAQGTKSISNTLTIVVNGTMYVLSGSGDPIKEIVNIAASIGLTVAVDSSTNTTIYIDGEASLVESLTAKIIGRA